MKSGSVIFSVVMGKSGVSSKPREEVSKYPVVLFRERIEEIQIGGEKYLCEVLDDSEGNRVTWAVKDGPYAGRPGIDFLAQGFAGLVSLNGAPDQPPVRLTVPLIDVMSSLLVVSGALAALHDRTSSGKGQRIEGSSVQSRGEENYSLPFPRREQLLNGLSKLVIYGGVGPLRFCTTSGSFKTLYSSSEKSNLCSRNKGLSLDDPFPKTRTLAEGKKGVKGATGSLKG